MKVKVRAAGWSINQLTNNENKILQYCSYVLQMISLKSDEAKVLKTMVVTYLTDRANFPDVFSTTKTFY